VIPGDHAVQLDGSPANLRPACNCPKAEGTALFVRTQGSDGDWRFTVRKDVDQSIEGGPGIGTEVTEDDLEAAAEITFGLERDLQSALRTNIEQLESGMKIVDEGRERATDAGRIDITAVDKNEKTVVIELKAGMAMPDAVAQVSRLRQFHSATTRIITDKNPATNHNFYRTYLYYVGEFVGCVSLVPAVLIRHCVEPVFRCSEIWVGADSRVGTGY